MGAHWVFKAYEISSACILSLFEKSALVIHATRM